MRRVGERHSRGGLRYIRRSVNAVHDAWGTETTVYQVAAFATNTVRLQTFSNYTILLVGTAAPRHNKVHVYWIDHQAVTPKHAGYLMGHEDWLRILHGA